MTTGTIFAIVLAFGAILAVIVSHLLARRSLQDIHVLVNRRLEIALMEVQDLKEEVVVLKREATQQPSKPSDAGRADSG